MIFVLTGKGNGEWYIFSLDFYFHYCLPFPVVAPRALPLLHLRAWLSVSVIHYFSPTGSVFWVPFRVELCILTFLEWVSQLGLLWSCKNFCKKFTSFIFVKRQYLGPCWLELWDMILYDWLSRSVWLCILVRVHTDYSPHRI